VAANAWSLGTGSSPVPSAVRTRGRRTRTRRPPRVTRPGSLPWRTAARSGLWRPLGPTSRATLVGEHGLQHLQAGPHGQGEQSLAGGAGQLGDGDGHLLGHVTQDLVGGGGVVGILRHGGALLVELPGGCPTPTPRQASGGDRHLNFHGNRDNLPRGLGRLLVASEWVETLGVSALTVGGGVTSHATAPAPSAGCPG
jgi:hypothetical protein